MNRHPQQLHRAIQFGLGSQVARAGCGQVGQGAGVPQPGVDFVVAITFSEGL
jgi:hypothetical protein